MLSISAKCRYGILAVLALGENYGGGLMQIKEISATKNIPRQYLEQIFNRLVNAGVVSSVRGKKGGYSLTNPPEKVSVLDLIEVLEGGIQLTSESNGVDAVNELFKQTESKLKTDLSITLAELIIRQQTLQANVMYHI